MSTTRVSRKVTGFGNPTSRWPAEANHVLMPHDGKLGEQEGWDRRFRLSNDFRDRRNRLSPHLPAHKTRAKVRALAARPSGEKQTV